jgi:hypothetical protein
MADPLSTYVHRRARSRTLVLLAATAIVGTFLALAPLPQLLSIPELNVERLVVPLDGQAAADPVRTTTTLPTAAPSPHRAATRADVADRHDPATLAGVAAEADRKSSGRTDAIRFTTIGVTVDHEMDRPVLVRLRESNRWEDWKTLSIEHDEGPDPSSREATARITSAPFWVRAGDGFELNTPPDAGDHIEVSLVHETGNTIRVTAPADKPAAARSLNQPDIIPRTAWGAAPPHEAYDYQSRAALGFVHHSVSGNDYGPDDVAGIMRAIQTFHQNTNGWNDFAYNFAVDKFGRTWEGRGGGIDLVVQGAHALGFNAASVGVVMLGEFGSVNPTPVAIQAVGQVLGWKLSLSGTDPTGMTTYTTTDGNERFAPGTTLTLPTIVGHRDTGATACPGQLLYDQLGVIRSVAKAAYGVGVNPIGVVDTWSTGAGSIRVTGWAVDGDDTASIPIHIYVDGLGPTGVLADAGNSTVGALFPLWGTPHGFDITINGLTVGTHNMCVWAINTGYGANKQLECRTVAVADPPEDPFGRVLTARAGPGLVHAVGIAFDPNTFDPINVHVYVDGNLSYGVTASDGNVVAGALYPAWGTPHGFDVRVGGLAGGTHTLCIYGINVGPGANSLIGCNDQLRVPTGSPIGWVGSAIAVGGQILLSGGAVDPDTADPINVHVYVDGVLQLGATADHGNAAIGLFLPEWGTPHGYDITVPGVGPGPHQVCVYAINVGPGDNNLLACRAV